MPVFAADPAGEGDDIFLWAPEPAGLAAPHGASVEHRPVFVRQDVLAILRPGHRIRINPQAGASHPATVKRAEQQPGGSLVVSGGLDGIPYGSFVFAVEGRAVAGTIRGPRPTDVFKLRYLDNGLHLVERVDESLYPPCAGGVPGGNDGPAAAPDRAGAAKPPGKNFETTACVQPGPVYDAMIVYSPAARQAMGGTDAARAACQLAIEETNQAYINSGVTNRVRLVYRDEIAYTEGASFSDHLNWVTNNSGVAGLRTTYRADVVSLWVNHSASCGIGWCYTGNSAYGFAAVHWSCATGYYSFGHEIGHNQGCNHAHGDPGSCSSPTYGYGHRWWGNSGTQWRTIMAYAPGTRIQFFSNPNVLFDGQPTGLIETDPNAAFNARRINETARNVEGFRVSRFDVWVDFSFAGAEQGSFSAPYNTVDEGIANVSQGVGASELPTLWIKAGSTAATPTISTPMVIKACGGTVTLGQ